MSTYFKQRTWDPEVLPTKVSKNIFLHVLSESVLAAKFWHDSSLVLSPAYVLGGKLISIFGTRGSDGKG